MLLYHGSTNIIEHPTYGIGNPKNDYGVGFYLTESLELAKEWACLTDKGGFANHYELNMESLSILNLTDGDYHILNWLEILIENRTFSLNSGIAREVREYIFDTYHIPYENYDVVMGYRADDSYFTFAKSFLNNGISLQKLENAMVLGRLGLQVVLKSEKAFEQITYIGHEVADGEVYYPKRMKRDQLAREEFHSERMKKGIADEIYMIDILREGWKNDDPRLQRIIFR